MAGETNRTTIRVLKDVPLDSTYTDTIKFGSASAQQAFFIGKQKYAFDNCTYQRVNSSVAQPRAAYTTRVPVIADNVYDCNYIMFQNSGFGNKWFYAFIKQVNYINTNNTEIVYELDDYQTWQFDFTVLPSIVEREHPNTDNLFENLEPEPFNVVADYITDPPLKNTEIIPTIVVMATTDATGQAVKGKLVGNIYSGVQLAYFNATDYETVNNYIQAYTVTNKLDAIVGIYMAPFPESKSGTYESFTFSAPKINNYTPRNKKLLSYPYCKIQWDNGLGDTQEYKYEDFCDFLIGADGNVVATPRAYNFYCYYYTGYPPAMLLTSGANGYQNRANPNCLSITQFPQCNWSQNQFLAWLVSSAPRTAFNAVMAPLKGSVDVASSLASGRKGSAVSAIAGAANIVIDSVSDTVNNLIDLSQKAQNMGKLGGMANSCSIPFLTKDLGFHGYQVSIKPEIAQQIDDYFDMFGYATNKLKVPNMEGRESWNYVKTNNVIIKGSLPVNAMDNIKAMFNRGIRFWHGDFVGNYALSNRPLSEVSANAN